MLKVAYCSDLHLEMERYQVHPVSTHLYMHEGIENKQNADVLILAGDIAPMKQIMMGHYDVFFAKVSNNFEHVIYVLGNHEYYEHFFHFAWYDLEEYMKKFPNIHVLDGTSVAIKGVCFVGATLWTDQNNRDPVVMAQSSRALSDFYVIRRFEDGMGPSSRNNILRPDDTASVHTKHLEAIKKNLDYGNQTVVISHHAPSYKSVHEMFRDPRHEAINHNFYSNLDHMFKEYPNIEAWVHGHTHYPFSYRIKGKRVLCNPRGYVGKEKQAKEFKIKHFTVKDTVTI